MVRSSDRGDRNPGGINPVPPSRLARGGGYCCQSGDFSSLCSSKSRSPSHSRPGRASGRKRGFCICLRAPRPNFVAGAVSCLNVTNHICADGANISYRAETPRGISYAASPRISYRRKAIYHSGVSRHAAPGIPLAGASFLAEKDSLRPDVAFSARKKGNFNRRLICFFVCNKEIPEPNNGKTTIYYRKARSGLFFLHHSLILFSFGRFAQISETFLFLSLILL